MNRGRDVLGEVVSEGSSLMDIQSAGVAARAALNGVGRGIQALDVKLLLTDLNDCFTELAVSLPKVNFLNILDHLITYTST